MENDSDSSLSLRIDFDETDDDSESSVAEASMICCGSLEVPDLPASSSVTT